jgi:hypothetical protein
VFDNIVQKYLHSLIAMIMVIILLLLVLILLLLLIIIILINSVALVRERPLPRPPLVGEVGANILQIEVVAWSAQRIPTAVF